MKIQVPQEHLDSILELYKPECRYLYDATLDFPKATGVFKLGDTYYTRERLAHMTSIEAQLCLNQLCYSAFGEWMSTKTLDHSIPFEEYLKKMKENMFIVDSRILFKMPIDSSKVLIGSIELMRLKKYDKIYLAILDYEFDDRKSKGQIKLALRL
jgi:hypothetical protein